jgi:hypothetical protein
MMDADTLQNWTGGCLCGAVRYEFEPRDVRNWFCHCRMCQQFSGAVVTNNLVVQLKDFRWTKGKPKYYESSRIARRGFCASCGSSLVFAPLHDNYICVQMGTMDNPELCPPKGHYGIEGHISWLPIDDSLEITRTEDDPWFQEQVARANSDD